MNPMKVNELVTSLRKRLSDPSKFKQVMAVAAGIALSRLKQLPSSELTEDSAERYFSINHALDVERKACELNELSALDVSLAEEVARAFWLQRYYNAHPVHPVPITGGDGHFLGKLTGAGHLISPLVMDLCKENDVLMLSAVNSLREMFTV